MARLPLAVALTTLVACASPAAPPPTTVASPPAPPPTRGSAAPAPSVPGAPILDIAPATLTWSLDDGSTLAMDAAGYLSISHGATAFLPVLFARLTASGDLQRPDGTTLATIDDAGAILVDGHDYGFSITRDGTASQRGERLTFAIAEDGAVSGTDPRTGDGALDPSSHYTGTAATRRAIMFAKIAWALWIPTDAPEAVPPGKAKPTGLATCDGYRKAASKALACAKADKEWTKRLQRAITRIDGYAAEIPSWGRDATAAACEAGATRLAAYFASRNCALRR